VVINGDGACRHCIAASLGGSVACFKRRRPAGTVRRSSNKLAGSLDYDSRPTATTMTINTQQNCTLCCTIFQCNKNGEATDSKNDLMAHMSSAQATMLYSILITMLTIEMLYLI